MADLLSGIDWREMFVPQVPLLELIIRGSFMYLGLFTLLRFVLKRESGAVSVTDLLVVVLLADASQNALAANYRSITEGLVLVTIIIFWSYVLDWLGFHSKRAEKMIFPRPILLVQDGQIQWDHMRRELITEDELMSQLRQQGVDELDEVKAVYMESNGQISVIKKHEDDDVHPPPSKKVF